MKIKGGGYLWPAIWAASIFATSCFYINNRVFVRAVAKELPTHPTSAAVNSFWDSYWWFFVKGWHMLEYAILFWLIRWAMLRSGQTRHTIWLPFSIAAAYAATDEFHQTFVKDRGGHVSDVLIDIGGALVAVAISLLAVYLRSRKLARNRSAT